MYEHCLSSVAGKRKQNYYYLGAIFYISVQTQLTRYVGKHVSCMHAQHQSGIY